MVFMYYLEAACMNGQQSKSVESDDELQEKLQDLVAEKQQTEQHIKELDIQIQRLESDSKSKN